MTVSSFFHVILGAKGWLKKKKKLEKTKKNLSFYAML